MWPSSQCETITAAEVSWNASLNPTSLWRHAALSCYCPRSYSYCIFIKQIINMSVWVCVCPPLRFFITLLRLCSLAAVQGGPGTGCEMADLVGGGGGEGEGGRLDLLVTINIKLLYKAPVDNIKELAVQSKQSGFIKKGLRGVGWREGWHPSDGWDVLNES